MLPNAYFLAKFRFDSAENEPAINLQILYILPILLTLTPNKGQRLRARENPLAPLLGLPRRGRRAGWPVGDTTADRQNFGKMLLVLGCTSSGARPQARASGGTCPHND